MFARNLEVMKLNRAVDRLEGEVATFQKSLDQLRIDVLGGYKRNYYGGLGKKIDGALEILQKKVDTLVAKDAVPSTSEVCVTCKRRF